MDEADTKLRQEFQELKAEVRRLKRIIEGGIIIFCLILLILFPQLLIYVFSTAGLVLFGCLVSPVRGMIFSYLFKRDGAETGFVEPLLNPRKPPFQNFFKNRLQR
jgi:hypothetical protein